MIWNNLIWTPVYLIYSRTINASYCSLLLSPPVLCFPILIVLIVRTSYSLSRAPIVCPLLIVFQLQTLFCLTCSTYTLLSGHRTIARTCISSVDCTPWSFSSLNCRTRLYICFTCLTSHPCALQLYLLDVSYHPVLFIRLWALCLLST